MVPGILGSQFEGFCLLGIPYAHPKHDATFFCLLTYYKYAGALPKGSRHDEIQPAETASSGRTAAPLTAGPTGIQPAPRRVVQEGDSGKARFVCCGFSGRKAGSKSNR